MNSHTLFTCVLGEVVRIDNKSQKELTQECNLKYLYLAIRRKPVIQTGFSDGTILDEPILWSNCFELGTWTPTCFLKDWCTLFFLVPSSKETNVTYYDYPLKIVQINPSTQLLSFDERNKCDVTLSIKVGGDPCLMGNMFLMILI